MQSGEPCKLSPGLLSESDHVGIGAYQHVPVDQALAIRRPGARSSIGLTCSAAPSGSSLSRQAIPAPILIWAHAAGTCGPAGSQAIPASDAASSAASRSPVCSATDSLKIVIRSGGKD